VLAVAVITATAGWLRADAVVCIGIGLLILPGRRPARCGPV